MNPKNMIVTVGVGLSVLLSACDRKESVPANTDGSSSAEEEAEAYGSAPPSSEETGSNARPDLRLSEHEENDGVHEWVLAGSHLGRLTIRLLFISNGQSTVAAESVLASKGVDDGKETVRISLRTKGPSVAGAEDDSPPSLAVSFDNLLAQSGTVDESAELPKGLLKMGSFAMEESTGFQDQNTESLYHCAYRSEGVKEGSYGKDLDSMIAASKVGLTIVAITLDWQPN